MNTVATVQTVNSLASTSTAIRLSLHVLAAAVWVGGQFVMAGLVPTLRSLGDDAPRRAAQRFGRLSWPAFWLLVITGFWNYAAVHGAQTTSSWSTAFALKMGAVVLSGVGAWLHTRATTPRSRGMWAGIGALASVLALILGVLLAG